MPGIAGRVAVDAHGHQEALRLVCPPRPRPVAGQGRADHPRGLGATCATRMAASTWLGVSIVPGCRWAGPGRASRPRPPRTGWPGARVVDGEVVDRALARRPGGSSRWPGRSPPPPPSRPSPASGRACCAGDRAGPGAAAPVPPPSASEAVRDDRPGPTGTRRRLATAATPSVRPGVWSRCPQPSLSARARARGPDASRRGAPPATRATSSMASPKGLTRITSCSRRRPGAARPAPGPARRQPGVASFPLGLGHHKKICPPEVRPALRSARRGTSSSGGAGCPPAPGASRPRTVGRRVGRLQGGGRPGRR